MKESNEKKEEEEGKSSNKRKEDDIEDVRDRTLFHADDLSNIVHRMKQGVERKEERKISKEKEAARIKKKSSHLKKKRGVQMTHSQKREKMNGRKGPF